jgi:hypothetical protein
MCMMDYSDGCVTTIEDGKYLRARAQHKCRECHRVIEAGESYHREVYLWESKFNVHKTCAHCMVVRGWLRDECGGWLYGDVEEDAREHVFNNRGYYGVDLYRAVVGMAWMWRTPSGRLLPVPAHIKTSDEMRAAIAKAEGEQP